MRQLFIFLTPLLFTIASFGQNVGIGTNNPEPSARLEVSSTNSGFLPPRMSYAQRNAIQNPVAGLIVWCTDCGTSGELSFFDGSSWNAAGNAGNSTSGMIPIAPTNLNVTVTSPLVFATLSWTDISTNELGYRIERKVGNGIFVQIGQLGSNNTVFDDSSITRNTTYTYRVYAYNLSGNSEQYSNEFQITTLGLPIVITDSISSIFNNRAQCGGHIDSDGGAQITAKGVCWSTNINPTTELSTKTYDGSGINRFFSNINGLFPNTTYHVRAYAINSEGTSYGDDLTFSTLPGTLTINEIYDLLTGGSTRSWKLDPSPGANALVVGTEGNPSEYYSGGPLEPNCQIDDVYTFSSSGTLNYNANGSTFNGGNVSPNYNCGVDRSYNSTYVFGPVTSTLEGLAQIQLSGATPTLFIGTTDVPENFYRIIEITPTNLVLRAGGRSGGTVFQFKFVRQ